MSVIWNWSVRASKVFGVSKVWLALSRATSEVTFFDSALVYTLNRASRFRMMRLDSMNKCGDVSNSSIICGLGLDRNRCFFSATTSSASVVFSVDVVDINIEDEDSCVDDRRRW